MDNSKKPPATIDDYIRTFPTDVQRVLEAVRQTIKEAAPQAQETIKYGMPAFLLNGNLVYFAAYKNHIGFYPTTSGMETSIEDVSKYKTGKGTLQFPLDQPMPFPLIRKIVGFRVNETLEKKAKKK